MMNWRRKKPSSASSSSTSSSSSHPHLISHVFPLSWLSRFKRTSDKPGSKTATNNQNGKQEKGSQRVVSSSRSPKHPTYNMDNRFYTQDNDGFWRISFSEENTGDVNKFTVPEHYFRNCDSTVKEAAAVAAATKKRSQKSKVPKTEILPEKEAVKKEAAKNESLQRTYRRIMEATEELHRELDEVNGYRKSVEKELSECELLHVMQMMGRADQRLPYSESGKKQGPVSRDSGSNRKDRFNGNDKTLEWQKLKDAKIKEVLIRNDKPRKSFYVNKGGSNTPKVRVNSPRMSPLKTEACKVKALESMKKAKMRKRVKELQLDDKAAGLGSFAVVKSSCDPQQDFKDSMLEMIREKRIRQPDELEELLACFLTLNADEYHDLIIKVFRQVWSELEEA